MCSHCDGSLSVWNLRANDKPVSVNYPHSKIKTKERIEYEISTLARICKDETPKYGPITKVVWTAVKSSYVFSSFFSSENKIECFLC
jgi:hypothetical protein